MAKQANKYFPLTSVCPDVQTKMMPPRIDTSKRVKIGDKIVGKERLFLCTDRFMEPPKN